MTIIIVPLKLIAEMIIYNEYPLLLYTSFNENNAVKELPFKVQKEGTISTLPPSPGAIEF